MMNVPHAVPCTKQGYTNKVCWLNALSERDNDNAIRQDDIIVCSECASFKDLINRGFGRRTADLALGSTIAKLLKQVADRNSRLDEARQQLEKKVSEMALMKIITDAVVKTRDLPRALKIILTGVTSGRAFGFNRAGIFLVDQRHEYLVGMDAVGPENWQSAIRIWNELHALSFERQINNILMTPELEKDHLHRMLESIKIPLARKSNFLLQALWSDKPTFFRKNDMDPAVAAGILKNIEFNEFVAVPLRAENVPLGLIVADNFYTNKAITEASIDALETLANTCTAILEITLLHEQLSQRLKELERANQLLRENQGYLLQAERLADIGRLAATVAHEFKTPLVTIGGHARRALREANTLKFKKKDLNIVISEVDRLEKITSEILEYSKPSKFDIKSHPINHLVAESLEFLEHRLSDLKIKLKVGYTANDPVVAVDERRFKQVMFNIIDNALDSMRPGMTLKVETRSLGKYAALDIRDTGCGISEELRDRIFTFFFTTKAQGSGLGLPISKRIIEDHGGYIEFESVPNVGTTFSVYFPVAGQGA